MGRKKVNPANPANPVLSPPDPSRRADALSPETKAVHLSARRARERTIIDRLVGSGDLHLSILTLLESPRPPDIGRRRSAIAERERVLALRWEKAGKSGPFVAVGSARKGRSYGERTEVDLDELNDISDDINKSTYRTDKHRVLVHILPEDKHNYIVLLSNGFGKDRAADIMRFSPHILARSLREDDDFRRSVISANRAPIDDCELMHYEMAMEGHDSDAADRFAKSRRGSISLAITQRLEYRKMKLEERKVDNLIGDDGRKAEPQINFDEYFSNQQENEEYGKIYDKVIKGIELTDQEVKMFGVYQARFLSGRKAGKEASKDEKIDL